jgi:hypothetical protein
MKTLFKITLFFSFLCLNAVTNAQNLSEYDKKGMVEADADWANGTAKYYISFGRTMNEKPNYSLYLEHLGLFKETYQCIHPPKGYNIRIEEKMEEKYGRDMFKNLKKDAQLFYDSLNKVKMRKAIFSTGEKHFLYFLNLQCDYFKDYQDGVELPKNFKINVNFTVNKKGKCKNLSMTKTEDVQFNDKLFSWFKRFFKYCRWLPAKENGTRIEEEKAYEIVFNPD